VYFFNSNSGHFANSISEESAIDGIRIANCSPQISNSTFSNNAGRGLTVSSGSPAVTNSILWSDGGDEISGSPSVTFSDVQGGYAGVGNINKDPLFLDPDIGDYRLDVCSAAIDAGDPVENLTADYNFGDFILFVDRVTAVLPGDPIWITDGESYEIFDGQNLKLYVDGQLRDTHALPSVDNMADNAADIYIGEYPNLAEGFSGLIDSVAILKRDKSHTEVAATYAAITNPCEGDLNVDKHVDGMDLSILAAEFARTDCNRGFDCLSDITDDGTIDELDLARFAADYGRSDCP
jgi:hypothetical protein